MEDESTWGLDMRRKPVVSTNLEVGMAELFGSPVGNVGEKLIGLEQWSGEALINESTALDALKNWREKLKAAGGCIGHLWT